MNADDKTIRTSVPEAAVGVVGAVDMGSKNFKFVLGRRDKGVVTTELIGKECFELGKEVTGNNGLIGEEKISQIRISLSRFVRYCHDRGASNVLAIATSAVRNARNHQHILDMAREVGLEVEIAEGAREGEIGYFAATGGLPNSLVSDAGSKSMQIAWEEGGLVRSRSVQVGYELAYESFLEHETHFADAQRKFCRFLDGNFTELPEHTGRYFALAANTVATFVDEGSQGGPDRTLDSDALAAAMARLRALSASGYTELKASLVKAEKVLPGLIFIDYIMARSGHEKVFVSQNELPVGLVVEYFVGPT